MNRDEAIEYARHWAEAWNRRDLDAVLGHFEETAVFSSPRAVEVVGTPSLHGKAEIGDYWRTSLSRIESLRFTVRRVIWDPESAELSIIYDREVNGRPDRAVEVLHFAQSGLVDRGEAFYGVIPTPDG